MIMNLIFKTVFGIVIAPLVCLKSVKYEIPGNFQIHSQDSDL
jgi:hypothetical protein